MRYWPCMTLVALLFGCRSEPDVVYPRLQISDGAAVDTVCPDAEIPAAWSAVSGVGGFELQLPATAELVAARDTGRAVRSWTITSNDTASAPIHSQIILTEYPISELMTRPETLVVPAATPRAYNCRISLASGYAEILSTGEKPKRTDQRPMMFTAWMPGRPRYMLQFQGWSDSPVYRDTLIAITKSLRLVAEQDSVRPAP